MSYLTNKLYTNKSMDCLSFPDLKNALDNIHKDFVVVPIDRATGHIALVCKIFYIHKDIFACLFSIHNTISLSCHEQVCLSGLRFERYFSHHRAT